MNSLWSKKSIKSRYILKNRKKYVGQPEKIIARSTWERSAFIWCEKNSRVLKWSSEELKIPYICATDKKNHIYYPDLWLLWADKTVSLIEIKPKREMKPPELKSRRTQRYIKEALTYVKNESKWKAAKRYCEVKGWKFEIWNEDIMRNKGIAII